MAAAPHKIIHLRQLLAERFGSTDFGVENFYPTSLPALDEIGIPRSAITEIVSPSPAGAGASLLLYALLRASAQKGERVALIDGRNAFSPRGLPAGELKRLLWLRCHHAAEALKAADLLARDGNLPLMILLLTLNTASELRRIPGNHWHRLHMLVEKSAVTLLVWTPAPQVGCARLRLSVDSAFPLGKLHRSRSELMPELKIKTELRRRGERRDHEELRRASCA